MTQDPIKALVEALHQDQQRIAELNQLYAKILGDKPGTPIQIKRSPK